MNNAINILDEWMDSINNKDVEKLAKLYDKEAVLIPTFSNRLLDTPEKIKDYFEKVGQKANLSISLHDKTIKQQIVAEHIVCVSGIYKWCFSVDDELLTFEARFSYILDLSKSSPILNHHSSQIPRLL